MNLPLPKLPATLDQIAQDAEYDVVVIGAGGAGLRAVIEARERGLRVAVVTKSLFGKAHTVMAEGGMAAVSPDWEVADVVLDSAGPAEVDARIRLVLGRANAEAPVDARISAAGVVIDEASYSARINGKPLDLTFKEFALLKFLTGNPGRVFTRDQLLSEVWGYDYFGGTRTVDVHIRRLRAKLGPELEAIIGTVRNVGYRFTLPSAGKDQFVDA